MNQSYDKSAIITNKQFMSLYFVYLQIYVLPSFNTPSYCCITLRFLNRASWYTYVIRTKKMHTLYTNYLI